MQTTIKYLIKTDTNRTYILHIVDAAEYKANQFVGVFLFDDIANGAPPDAWNNLRHRLLFENSVEAIKDKVTEYAHGRNENITFIESHFRSA